MMAMCGPMNHTHSLTNSAGSICKPISDTLNALSLSSSTPLMLVCPNCYRDVHQDLSSFIHCDNCGFKSKKETDFLIKIIGGTTPDI